MNSWILRSTQTNAVPEEQRERLFWRHKPIVTKDIVENRSLRICTVGGVEGRCRSNLITIRQNRRDASDFERESTIDRNKENG